MITPELLAKYHQAQQSFFASHGEGKKNDAGKPAFDLIPPRMELEVAKVLEFGARKYGPNNWRQLDNLKARYIAAAKRHINAISRGECTDPETGLLHAAHAVCCLMFLGEAEFANADAIGWPDTDDRIDAIGQNGNTGEHYEQEWLG